MLHCMPVTEGLRGFVGKRCVAGRWCCALGVVLFVVCGWIVGRVVLCGGLVYGIVV